MKSMDWRLRCDNTVYNEIYNGRGGFVWNKDDLDMIGFSSESTGPRLNIKTVLSAYGDFHVKDKTAVRTSYL